MASWIRYLLYFLFYPQIFLIILSCRNLASTEFVCEDIFHEAVHTSNDDGSGSGISIKQILRNMKLEYCILGKKEVCLIRNEIKF